MSSATEVLRRMLDERGVEHYDGIESTLWLKDEHGYRASADELTSGRLSVHIWCDTPEQAIAATLGAGTCKVESSVAIEFDTLISPDFFEFEMGCGYRFRWSDNEPPDHCPGCGRKVMDE